MNDLDLLKLDIVVGQTNHGPDYIHDLLCMMGDCITNPEELEMYDYLADKIMAEYKYVLDRLTHSETERFHIGGKRR